MIKTLRIRFIALAMASLFLVLAVIIGAVNILNYRSVAEHADRILTILSENGGDFPPPAGPLDKPEPRKYGLSPETPFESRYFSVRLDAAGEIVSVDTDRIAAMDGETAAASAYAAWRDGGAGGFLGDYRFVRLAEDGGTQIIFLDCGRSLSTFRAFLLTSCGVSALGLLAVFVLLLVFSPRIIRPVSESYEKQKRFITDAGHEIKTPLTIIDADASILAMEYGGNEWLQDIQTQTRRLSALTNGLIDLSRMEEDRPPLQRIEFPFSDLAEEMVQSFRSLARVQGKTFTSDIQPMLTLCGDQKALGQLLSILLDNALKYSGDGGAIDLRLTGQGKLARLAVSNTTAAPITQEQLSRVFDRFYRTDQSRNSQTGGYGIGLSVARAIVTAHRGKIAASTRDGRSMTVTVELPACGTAIGRRSV